MEGGKNMTKKQDNTLQHVAVGAAIGAIAVAGREALKSPLVRAGIKKVKEEVNKKISVREKDVKKEIDEVNKKLKQTLPKTGKK